MLIFIFLYWYALSIYDAWFTAEHLRSYPLASELNHLVRTFTRWMGPDLGAFLGVMLPSTVLGLIGMYHSDLLYFLAGARTTLFSFQLFRKYGLSDAANGTGKATGN